MHLGHRVDGDVFRYLSLVPGDMEGEGREGKSPSLVNLFLPLQTGYLESRSFISALLSFCRRATVEGPVMLDEESPAKSDYGMRQRVSSSSVGEDQQRLLELLGEVRSSVPASIRRGDLAWIDLVLRVFVAFGNFGYDCV